MKLNKIKMTKVIKILSVVFLVMTFTVCGNENGEMETSDGEAPEEQGTNEEVTRGMEQYWMEQREEFTELVETRLDEWEEYLEEHRESEAVAGIKNEIEHLRERLSDLEQIEESEWEERREEIAGEINDLQNRIEDLEE